MQVLSARLPPSLSTPCTHARGTVQGTLKIPQQRVPRPLRALAALLIKRLRSCLRRKMSVKKRARDLTRQLTPLFHLSLYTCQKTLLCGVPPQLAAAQHTHKMEG